MPKGAQGLLCRGKGLVVLLALLIKAAQWIQHRPQGAEGGEVVWECVAGGRSGFSQLVGCMYP